MQPGATTCTEDRIQHALERCLHGLSLNHHRSTSWSGRSEGLGGALKAQASLRGCSEPWTRHGSRQVLVPALCDFADSWISPGRVLGTAPDGEALSVQQFLLSPVLSSSSFPGLYLASLAYARSTVGIEPA